MRGRAHRRRRAIAIGGAFLAGVAAGRLAAAAKRRARRLERGELRELSDMWTWVDDERWYVRMCAAHRDGPARPIVLVHGFGISSVYFVPLAERLAVHGDVYAPDLPGHGLTDTPAAPLGVAGLARALARWLDVMRLGPACVIGHSMGCQTAVELALRRPELVDTLVLVGPTARPRTKASLLPRFLRGGLHEPAGMSLLLARDYARMGIRLVPELRAMLAYPLERFLPRLPRIPVLIVRGEHDRIASERRLEELAAAAPNARIVTIAGGAHAVHYSRPDDLAATILAFIDAPSRKREGAPRGVHSAAGSSRRIVPSAFGLP